MRIGIDLGGTKIESLALDNQGRRFQNFLKFSSAGLLGTCPERIRRLTEILCSVSRGSTPYPTPCQASRA